MEELTIEELHEALGRQVIENARLSTERSKLAELLLEALEWNWCDDDYPEGLRDECEAAANAVSGKQ